jgi:hypothetical protein
MDREFVTTMQFQCPKSTRRRSVLLGIAAGGKVSEYIGDVKTGPLVAPVLRWGRGRTVCALFYLSQ